MNRQQVHVSACLEHSHSRFAVIHTQTTNNKNTRRHALDLKKLSQTEAKKEVPLFCTSAICIVCHE